MSAAPRVSVVVPVYNALPYLRECLDSLAAQDLDPAAFDIIAVDDGSTDGSAAALDAFCAGAGNARVIHQANSGGPGGPRNLGVRSSSADYVFFADADDVMAPDCLRRVVEFADEQHSDIVIPRLAPLGGRSLPTSVYQTTVVDADLVTVFGTLFPQKLYRRSMLLDHGIEFPEGRVRWEDGIFNARAYVHAKRISILGDRPYYFLRGREDGGNLSGEELEPVSYTSTVTEICRIVREHVNDAALADRIVLGLYRRKCLHIYHPSRFAQYDEATQRAWIAAHQAFAAEFVTRTMERRLESPLRERSYFIRLGDWAGVLAFGERAVAPAVTGRIAVARWCDEGLELVIDAAIQGRLALPRQLVGELRSRNDDGSSAFPLVRQEGDSPAYGEAGRYRGVLPDSSIEALLPGMYDLHLVSLSGQERLSGRIAWDQAGGALERGRFRIYGTKGGHAAIDKRAAATVDLALRKAFTRVVTSFGLRR